MKKRKKKLTTEAEKSGSRGGLQTLKKHGTTHFAKAANARWVIHRKKKEALHRKEEESIVKE